MGNEEILTFPNNIIIYIRELLGENKKLSRLYSNKFLKEEIERYLESTLVQLVLVSGVYNDSTDSTKKEDFTLDMIDSIFNDDSVVYQDENIVLTLGFLIRELNTKYGKIEDFYAPIKEYRKLALRAEAVYKKEYNRNGIEGLKAVYDSFDVFLDDTVDKTNLDKVSPSKSVQRDLVDTIILNRRGLPLSETPEENEEHFYNQMAKSFQKENRNKHYKTMYT